jgi:WD40 repeat protein
MPRIAFTQDGKLSTTEGDGTVQDWDPSTGNRVGEPRKGRRSGVPESRSPDGQLVMTGNGEDNSGFLRRIVTNADGEEEARVVGTIQPPGGVGASAFSPDSKLVVTCGGSAWLWDVATLKPIGPPLGQALAVAFSPDGQWILTGGSDGAARLRRVPSAVEGEVERVRLWVQLQTNSELVQQVRRLLRADDWQKRQKRLEELGGSPVQ